MSTPLPVSHRVARLREPVLREARTAGHPASNQPVLAISRESTVSVRVVRALFEAASHAGVEHAKLWRAAALSPAELHGSDTRIARARVYQLCELALDLSGDPALGLHWAERLTESTFVPISHLIAHAPTLRHGFEMLAQFDRLLSDDPGYQIFEQDHKVMLRMVPLVGASDRMQRFLAEMMVAGFFRLLRDFSREALPDRIGFAYAAPPHRAEYTRVFERPVLFEQSFTGIAFDRSLLDLPAPHEDEEVHAALRAVAERRLLDITQRTTYAQRVREFLIRQGGPHRTDMEEAARAVGLSVRSLRRRLSAESNSYQAVANEALMVVAKHLLLNKQHTIQETAFAMGFADARSFHRAFRRWTGTTPSAYRRAARDPRPSSRSSF